MNKRRIIMLLSVLIVTILTASGMYLLESETDSKIISVEANKNPDYELIEADDGPYTAPNGKKCYVKYTGSETHRTTVDIADDLSKTGKINGIKITTTDRMFSKDGSNTDPENDVTRVFIPDTIAIDNDGIAANTFIGTSESQEIDCIYKTGDITKERTLANGNKISARSLDARGSTITSDYDKTGRITQSNVKIFVYLGSENIEIRTSTHANTTYTYNGEPKNVYLSNSVSYPSHFFDYDGKGTFLISFSFKIRLTCNKLSFSKII